MNFYPSLIYTGRGNYIAWYLGTANPHTYQTDMTQYYYIVHYDLRSRFELVYRDVSKTSSQKRIRYDI